MGSGAGGIYAETYGSGRTRPPGSESSNSGERHAASNGTNRASEGQGSSIEKNAANVDERYRLNDDGYFCDRGTGRDDSFRQFISSKPKENARELFDTLGRGGETEALDGGKGVKTTLDDMTRIVFREQTRTQGSPAVSIGRSASPRIKNQKIHFVGEGKK